MKSLRTTAITALSAAALFAASNTTVTASETEARALAGTEKNWEVLCEGGACLLVDGSKAASASKSKGKHALAAIIIDAPVATVWEVVNDKEAAVDYVDNLKYAKVLAEEGNVSDVEQHMKMSILLPMFKYVVRHTRTPQSRVDFKRVSGDLNDIEGWWRFLPLEDGSKTLLVYSLRIDPGLLLIPQGIIDSSIRKSLPDALKAVREQVYKLGKKG